VLPDAEVAVGAPPELEAVVAVGADPELEAVVAVGADPEAAAVVAVGADPELAAVVAVAAGVGVSLAPPHAESVMTSASARGATCKLMRLFTFIAVLFLLRKLNRNSSLIHQNMSRRVLGTSTVSRPSPPFAELLL
jgi:hypothetical protein